MRRWLLIAALAVSVLGGVRVRCGDYFDHTFTRARVENDGRVRVWIRNESAVIDDAACRIVAPARHVGR